MDTRTLRHDNDFYSNYVTLKTIELRIDKAYPVGFHKALRQVIHAIVAPRSGFDH